MDAIEAIKSRRSIRAWTGQNITDDILSQILEAGRWSPSPLNSQPWHFIVVKEKETIESLSLKAQEGSFLQFTNTCIVITVNKHNSSLTDKNDAHASLIVWLEKHDQYVYSAVCALQNMWLAAWNLGLGGCWVTVDEETTREILEIPDDQVIIGSLALGYVKGTSVPHRELDRKPLSEIVFFEKYGVRR
ncbi:MAG: hypothetical protein A2857_00750 [Candidatus Levybacteria bacterium RIFCSPHIGHO2_01_FULL_36_15]|nr:MAG: hypothetical protein A2857_00750 [Candidatus Levybacteria bacterium RIFCSPHIGHO2_01_FULL_36_15]